MKLGKPTRFKGPREKRNTALTHQRDLVSQSWKKQAETMTQYPGRMIHLDNSEGFLEVSSHLLNPVKIFLDDERPCPEGWTLVKNCKEFFSLLDNVDTRYNVTQLSLDWYLGNTQDGVVVATQLAEKFFTDLYYLPNLQLINLHSSDREQAFRMKRILSEINDGRSDDHHITIQLRSSRG
jgi:hypothetical protein